MRRRHGSRSLLGRVRGSVRLRITLAATLAFALAFGLAAWMMVRAVQHRLEDEVRNETMARVDAVVAQMESGVDPTRVLVSNAGATRIQIIQGARTAGEAWMASVAEHPGVGAGGVIRDEIIPVRDAATPAGDLLMLTSQTTFGGQPYTVFAASPLAEVQRSVDALGQVLLVTTPALVAALGVLVWWLVGRALRPVAAITREVEEITHTTMHRRVPEPSSHDEVHELARTMNDMLTRLETAQERQRAFVSDASHELRTPVATVHTALEVGLRNGDLDGAARSALDANRRLQDVLTDLLDLARLDEVEVGQDAPIVDLEEVVIEQAGAQRDVRVDVGAVVAGRVRGERDALGRVVRNLVDNALRHARSAVAVSVATVGEEVVLTVDDDGPGVPASQRESVFERFVRLDHGRDRRGGGTGLGLAIVRRVVEQHHGTVGVSDAPTLGGARFEVRLPSAAPIGTEDPIASPEPARV